VLVRAGGIGDSSIAIGLSGGTQNNGVIPLNKNMWSLSFIFAMAAMGNACLIVCYVLVDVTKWWNGAPFIYAGMNSIAVYVLSEVMGGGKFFPFFWHPDIDANLNIVYTHGFMLMQNLVAIGLYLLIAYYMHTIKFYVKV